MSAEQLGLFKPPVSWVLPEPNLRVDLNDPAAAVEWQTAAERFFEGVQ